MANNYTKIQPQKAILDKLYNRYEAVVKKVKMVGEPLDNDRGEKTTLPRSNFQSIYEQKVEYNKDNPTPYIITVKDLQKAINFLEQRFSENCDCPTMSVLCQTCQHQCTTDNGYNTGCQSCQYVTERLVCQSWACQTLKCQTINPVKSCETCQSCQYCQKEQRLLKCQSCQMFECQTLRCEYPKPQCVCQTCQTNCSQCSCQETNLYNSCQSQCMV